MEANTKLFTRKKETAYDISILNIKKLNVKYVQPAQITRIIKMRQKTRKNLNAQEGGVTKNDSSR